MLLGLEMNNSTCTSPTSNRCVKTGIFRTGFLTAYYSVGAFWFKAAFR